MPVGYWDYEKPKEPEEPVEQKEVHVPTVTRAPLPEPPSLSLPDGAYGIPIPYIIGKTFIASPNVIWVGNVELFRIETREYEADGDVNINYDEQYYELDIQFLLCLGPGVKLHTILDGKNTVIWTGTAGPTRTVINTGAIAGNESQFRGNVIFYGGNYDQPIESIIDADTPEDLQAYTGQSYILLQNARADKLGTVGFEVSRYPDPLGLGVNNLIGDDINPMTALVDLLTSDWGGCGFSDIIIDDASLIAAAAILKSEGNGLSLAYQSALDPKSVIKLIQDQIDGFIFIHPETNLVTVSLIRPQYYDFLSNDAFELDVSNVIRPAWTKTGWVDAVNRVKGNFTNRSKNYMRMPAMAETIDIKSSGGRVRNQVTVNYPGVCTAELANELVQRDLNKLSRPAWFMELIATRSAADLVPGDIVKLTFEDLQLDGEYGIVTDRRTQPINENLVNLRVQQFKTPTNNALWTPPENGSAQSFSTEPLPPLDPPTFVSDAPYFFSGGFNTDKTQDIAFPFILPMAATKLQNLFNAYIDETFDGTFAKIITEQAYPSTALLNGAMTQFQDTTDGIIATVDIDGIDFAALVASGDAAGVRAVNGSIVLIGNELLMFEGFSMTTSTAAQLTNVHRALFDTVPEAHADNARVFVFTKSGWAKNVKFTLPVAVDPEFKFTSIRTSDHKESAALDYNDWEPDSRWVNPLRPHNTKIDGSARSSFPKALTKGASSTITWFSRNRLDTVNRLQLDAGVNGEDNSGDLQRHRVWIRDSAAVDWDCGATAETTPTPHTLSITVPAGAANGVGTLWVEAETDYGTSERFRDTLPITLS